MHGLKTFYQENDRSIISERLERLFVLQGRSVNEKTINAFITEFEDRGLTFRAVVAGLESLKDDDIKILKLSVFLNAINVFREQGGAIVQCDDCGSSGYVLMADGEGRYYALGCRCINGEPKVRAQQLTMWNGQGSQNGRNGILFKQARG